MEYVGNVIKMNGQGGMIMNCKHVIVKGTTTKYFYCRLKNTTVDDYKCRDCMLKLPNLPEGFEEIFGKGFKK